jgi:hypothetical protein
MRRGIDMRDFTKNLPKYLYTRVTKTIRVTEGQRRPYKTVHTMSLRKIGDGSVGLNIASDGAWSLPTQELVLSAKDMIHFLEQSAEAIAKEIGYETEVMSYRKNANIRQSGMQ